MAKVKDYVRNLGKSVRYASVDVVKEMMPNATEFVENNNDLFKEISSSIRNKRVIFNKVGERVNQSKIYDAIDETKRSIFEDIKSGKLYNKDPIRERRINKKSGMDMDFGADDFDFDFGDDTFDFDDDDFGELAGAIDESNRTSSSMIATAMALSADHQVKANRMMNQMTLMQMQEGFTTINTNLGNIGSTITQLGNNVGSIVQTSAENSKTYYEKTTELQTSMAASLKELVDLTKQVNGISDNKSGSSYNKSPRRFEDVTNYNGVPDLKSYGQLLAKKVTDNMSMLTSMNDMGGDGNMLMQMALSPLSFMPKAAVKSVIGSAVQASARNLDNTIANVFGTIISKFNEMSDDAAFGSVRGMIGDFFGLSQSLKSERNINLDYDKGNKPWNGKAEKALVEVIPTLLSKQLAIMSNQSEMTYDYDKAKFIKVADLKSELNRRKENEMNMAFYDIKEGMDNIMKAINLDFQNSGDKDDFDKDYKRFFEYFFKSNQRFNPNKKDYEDYSGIGISKQNYQLIESVYNQLDPHLKMSMDRSKLRGRDSYNSYIENLSKNNPVYSILANDSGLTSTDASKNNMGSSMLSTSYDDRGRSVFWYLRTITETLLTGIKTYVVNGTGNGTYPSGDFSSILNRESIVSADSANLPKSTKVSSNSLYNLTNSPNALMYNDLMYSGKYPNIDAAISANYDIAKEKIKLDAEDNRDDTIIDDLLRSKSVPEKLKRLLKGTRDTKDKSRNAISKLFDRIDESIYHALYGQRQYKGKDVEGIMEVMMMNIEDSFTKMNTFIDEKVLSPLKEKLDEFGGFRGMYESILEKFGIDPHNNAMTKAKDKLFGPEGVIGKTWTAVKEDTKSIFNYAKNSVKDVYSEAYEKIGGNDYNSKFNRFKNVMRYGKQNVEGMYAVDQAGQLNILNQIKKTNNMSGINSDGRIENSVESIDGQLNLFNSEEKDAINEFSKVTGTDPNALGQAINTGEVDSHAIGGDIRKTKIALVHRGEKVLTVQEAREYDRKQKYDERIGQRIEKLNQVTDSDFVGPLAKKDQKARDMVNSIDDDNFESMKQQLGDKFISENVTDLRKEIIDMIGHKEGQPTLFEQMKDTTADGMNNVFSVLFGVEPGEKADDLKDKAKNAWKDIAGRLKEYLPSIGSGALIGGVAGGLVGMPMIGAAVGSSINLIRKSDELQSYLFGDKDDEGNRIGNGKLPQKLVQAMEQYGPDMKKYGITGAITSVLPFVPGGPIAGLMIGAGVGFAKNNAAVQDYLFGEAGLMKGAKEKGEKFKKALPKMGVGAAALALTGPFGLAGNLLLGAGIGFATQTNKFQEFMFGKDDVDDDGNPTKVGGFLPMIRDRVVEPIKEFGVSLGERFKSFVDENIKKPFHKAMSPFIEEFKHMGKTLFDGIKDSINGIFERSVGKPLNTFIEEKIIDPFTGLFKKLFGTLGKIVGGVLSIPGKIVTGAANNLRYKHLKEGRGDYITDEELGDLKANNPYKFFRATKGQEFINKLQENGVFSLFRGLFQRNETENPEETEDVNTAEQVTKSMADKIRERASAVKDNLANTFGGWADDVRNARQNLKTKAYQAAGVAADKLSSISQAGARTREMQDNAEESEGEPSASTVVTTKQPNATIVEKSSSEVQDLRNQIKQLNQEIAVLSAEKEGQSEKGTTRLGNNVQDIRDEVYGQLDGIGYNVHTIANILVERFGMPETEAKGSKVSRGNLKRQKWFEQMFGFIMNPAKKVKDAFKSLLWGRDGNGGLIGTPMRVVNAALDKIGNIGDWIAKGFSLVGNTLGSVVHGIGILGGVFKESLAAVVPAFGQLLAGAVKLVTLPIDLLTGAAEGIGKMLGGLADGIGMLGGKMIELVGLIPSLIGHIGDLAIQFGSFAFNLGKTIVKGIGGFVSSALGGVFNIFSGKAKKKVIVHKMDGGKLDSVTKLGSIEETVNVIDIEADTRQDKLFNFLDSRFERLYDLLGNGGPSPKNNTNMDYDITASSDESQDTINGRKLLPNTPTGMFGNKVPFRSHDNDPNSLYNLMRHGRENNFPVVKETTELPTEFGVIRYDRDESGELRPIQDTVYTQYMEHKNEMEAYNSQMFNILNTGEADGDTKGTKQSFFSKLASNFGSVLMGAGLLKVVGAGLMAGALYDISKNGDKSFAGKLVSMLGEAIQPVFKTVMDDVVPALCEGLGIVFGEVINAAIPTLKELIFGEEHDANETVGNTSEGYSISSSGIVYNDEGKMVYRPANYNGNITDKFTSALDSLRAGIGSSLGITDGTTVQDYVDSQMQKISEFVKQTGMSASDYRKYFLTDIDDIYGYRKSVVSLNPVSAYTLYKNGADLYNNQTDLVERFKNSQAGQKFLNSKNISTTNTSGKGKNIFYSQRDPRWANTPFNTSMDTEAQTMADSGCGPAVAAMAADSYYEYGKANPVEAANYAINGGYKEKNGGTDPRFFMDYLGSKGIDSEVNNNVNRSTSKKQNVVNDLRKGKPVVLMGKSNGGSTPYGDGPHYVLATGVNGDRIQVNDPDSYRGGQLYDLNDTLNSSTVSVNTKFGTGKKRNKFGRANLSSVISSNNVSSSVVSDNGSLSTGTTAFNFIQDLGTTFTNALGELFGVDLYATTKASDIGANVTGSVAIGNGSNIDASIAADVINEFFKNSSKLRNKGAAIVNIAKTAKHKSADSKGKQAGIDPFLLCAVIMQETGGNSSALNNKNNPGGVMDPNNTSVIQSFTTIEDGIMAVAKIIHREWICNGNNTIEGLGAIYSPVGAANDPNGLNQNWVAGVSKFYNQLVQAATAKGGVTGASANSIGVVGEGNAIAQNIVKIAQSYVGKVTYLFGKSNPDSGYSDCSGFTQHVYKKVGISIGRDTKSQLNSSGFVQVTTPQAGDLIFLQGTYRSGVSHVGIVTGVGTQYIDCGGGDYTGGVRVSDYSSAYTKKHFLCFARHPKCVQSVNTPTISNPLTTDQVSAITPFNTFSNSIASVKSTGTTTNSATTNKVSGAFSLLNSKSTLGKGKSSVKKPNIPITRKPSENAYKTSERMFGKGVVSSANNTTSNARSSIRSTGDLFNTLSNITANTKLNRTNASSVQKAQQSNSGKGSVFSSIGERIKSVKDSVSDLLDTNTSENIQNTVQSRETYATQQAQQTQQMVAQQQVVNSSLASSISELAKTTTNIYNLLAIIVSSGIDIKNITELIKSISGGNNTIINATASNQSSSGKDVNSELIGLLQSMAKQ